MASGAEAIGVQTDVTDIASVQALSEAARERFGIVHVLCNNAGVGPPAEPQLWLNTPNDWRWTFEDTFAVVRLNVFMPHMVEHGEDGHVINTSSTDGASALCRARVYASSKAAVVTLTECLAHQLKELDSRIGARCSSQRAACCSPGSGPRTATGRPRSSGAPGLTGHDRQSFRELMASQGRESIMPLRRWPVGRRRLLADRFWILPDGGWTTRSGPADAIIDRKALRPRRRDLIGAPWTATSSSRRHPCRAAQRGVPRLPRPAVPRGLRPRPRDQLALSSVILEAASEEQEKFREDWEEETGDGGKLALRPDHGDAELDKEGIAAEVIFPDADVLGGSLGPFSAGLQSSGELDGELVMAGARPTTAGWPSSAPPVPSVAAASPPSRSSTTSTAVAEMHRGRQASVDDDPHPVGDKRPPRPVYEPVWSAAEDRPGRQRALRWLVEGHPARSGHGADLRHRAWWWAARPLWVLLWSGVFDRHPDSSWPSPRRRLVAGRHRRAHGREVGRRAQHPQVRQPLP